LLIFGRLKIKISLSFLSFLLINYSALYLTNTSKYFYQIENKKILLFIFTSGI